MPNLMAYLLAFGLACMTALQIREAGSCSSWQTAIRACEVRIDDAIAASQPAARSELEVGSGYGFGCVLRPSSHYYDKQHSVVLKSWTLNPTRKRTQCEVPIFLGDHYGSGPWSHGMISYIAFDEVIGYVPLAAIMCDFSRPISTLCGRESSTIAHPLDVVNLFGRPSSDFASV